MQTIQNGVQQGSDRFDYVEGLLAQYPEIEPGQLEDLKRWFKKEASAFEVARLASNESTRASYTAFRSEHVDPFKPKDYLVAALAIALVASAIVYFAL